MRSAAALFMIFSTVIAQTPQFEVASIKPSAPGATNGMMSGGPGTKDPSLFTCENISLRTLVVTAFNLLTYRFSGPDWMGAARFNVSAKIPEGTTREQFLLMLQSLLVDRFQMAIHWEKKEIQTYDLAVAKSGHKMKESIPDGGTPAPQPASPPKADTEGFPLLPPGRQSILAQIGNHVAMRRSEETMDRLAVYLSAQLHTPVSNATGLTGKYDFTLHWVSDGTPSTDDTGPNLFRAVQEQLGLRLESKKGTVDILMVDHAEKTPTEN
jgi:uncharacterized protein (TIGR03435 family)